MVSEKRSYVPVHRCKGKTVGVMSDHGLDGYSHEGNENAPKKGFEILSPFYQATSQ